MSYKKNKYKIIKNAIPLDVANFVHDYFIMKREVFFHMKNSKYISKYNDDWGKMGDDQCPQSYNHYSDVAMDTILSLLTDKMNKETGLKLSPTYSYARIYNKGESLEKHTDRYSCEVSTTLCLGGDVWPIWLTDTKKKDVEVKLNPSDMLIYSGCELEHWRDKFEGNQCVQVFLHYNDTSNPKWENNKYDNRQHLGLPVWFKGKKLL
jgi:hypothetical protein|tara:strand:+ start:3529 stop:4149 length:621 start_codon:yes stop_codon:yes gene_type:complete